MDTHEKQNRKNILENPNLTPEDCHYLRFVMKQSQCFEAILTGEELQLGERWKESYEAVSSRVDTHRLNQYLRRQAHRHMKRSYTDAADGFLVSPKGYRYADHGIYLTMKTSRKRLFIPLTDGNAYSKQVYIRLYPEEGKVTVGVPVEIRQKHPAGYSGETGLAFGLKCMFVTDQGNAYGERYLEYQSALTDYVRERLPCHRKNAKNNPGMKKYNAGKTRREKALHDYVNAEINRMPETEKPGIFYYPKLPARPKAGFNKRANATVSMWQRGFIKNRLLQKCRERSVELKEVFGKGISSQYSRCGAEGQDALLLQKLRPGDARAAECGGKRPEKGTRLKRRKRYKKAEKECSIGRILQMNAPKGSV